MASPVAPRAAATMNFFEHQHAARRHTLVMIVLFLLAVIGVVIGLDIFLAALYAVFQYWLDPPLQDDFGKLIDLALSLPPEVFKWGAIVAFTLIMGESLRQIFKLRTGGQAIAAAFGARLVEPGTSDPRERQLLNIVDEMAIASGVRVPAVYVMGSEDGINAFAAGFNVSNTVIAVTRGTLDSLSRDELQGVIGHEFSHILNGDMTLNIRMMGVLAGIVAVGSIGLFMIRNAFDGDDIRASAFFFVVGSVLCIIGFSGVLFARLIKAAVSREREFLADASSVQFTRNPNGIAGALDKIRLAANGALIRNRYAEEVSHMFFGQSLKTWFDGWFATHPPLGERIRRINPAFQRPGTWMQDGAAAAGADSAAEDSGLVANLAGTKKSDAASTWQRSAKESAALVGTACKAKTARQILAAIPPEVREHINTPDGARASVVALLLDEGDMMEKQLIAARKEGAWDLASAAAAVANTVRRLPPALHLPLIDLALPAIKMTSDEARSELLKTVEAVIYADHRVTPHEFVVLMLLRFQLGVRQPNASVKYKSIAAVRTEALCLLSLVARAGCSSAGNAEELNAAFGAGLKVLGLEDNTPPEQFSRESAEAALTKLRMLAPLQKAVLIKALFAATTADGTIRVIEAELMRMIGAVLDCPLPPLLDEMDPAALAA